uniref:Uncharacterized protein n=1 Tax=Knipowitschia caucasica TaxID=637954 RepID=A0AAV2KKP2_KNICA
MERIGWGGDGMEGVRVVMEGVDLGCWGRVVCCGVFGVWVWGGGFVLVFVGCCWCVVWCWWVGGVVGFGVVGGLGLCCVLWVVLCWWGLWLGWVVGGGGGLVVGVVMVGLGFGSLWIWVYWFGVYCCGYVWYGFG